MYPNQDSNILDKIIKLLAKYSKDEQAALLKNLQEKYLMDRAKELDQPVEENEISMEDIVEDVLVLRKL